MSTGEAAGQQGDAQGQGQGEAGQGEQQGAPDYAALLEGQQQTAQALEQMREYLQSNPWQQQDQGEPQQEQQFEPPQLDFLDSGDPDFDQQLASNLQNLIQTEAAKIAQQQYQPLQQDLQELRRERAAEALIAEFPELNEPENAQRVIGISREYAEMMGQPELATNPDFWRVIHAAEATFRAAAEEKERGDTPAAHLEGAGGPGAGQQPQVDLGDLIVNGQGEGEPLGRRALPF